MSLPNKLMAARMINATIGSSIDNKVGELETAICDILGLPLDTDVSIAITSIDATGRLTAAVRFAAAQDPTHATPVIACPRIRDTANSDEAIIVVEDGYLRVYENTGTETTPIWTERNKMQLSDGVWDKGIGPIAWTDLSDTESSYGTADKGRCVAVNDAGDGLEIEGPVYCHVQQNQSQSIGTSPEAIEWKLDINDDAAMHDPLSNPSRITVPFDGLYLIEAKTAFLVAASGRAALLVYTDGTVKQGYSGCHVPLSTSSVTVVTLSSVVELSSSEYLEIYADQTLGSALSCSSGTLTVTLLR